MTADQIIQKLGVQIYESPLSAVRDEPDYPDLDNPLHFIVLLVDCDTEITMNGIIGYLENPTGAHLPSVIDALLRIGAGQTAQQFAQIRVCMAQHGVTWECLREDFPGTHEYQITSFRSLHGEELDEFADDVASIATNLNLFNPPTGEPVYDLLCTYLDRDIPLLLQEIKQRDGTVQD